MTLIQSINKLFTFSKKNYRKLSCNAPFSNLFLGIDGNAYPCCLNQQYSYGNYTNLTIKEIWNGEKIKLFREIITKNECPSGCENCFKIINNGYELSDSYQFLLYDKYTQFKTTISQLEFQTGNICNLECQMCTGILSSQISKNREGINNITQNIINNYDESFYEVLNHLKLAHFSGGEPFLSHEYFTIWEYLQKNNSECKIYIQTNGTILNNKVKELLNKSNIFIGVSIDSINANYYDKIRINASFENVIDNITYFKKYMDDQNKILTVAICIMNDNYLEIPSLVRYFNSLGVLIYFNDVVFPASKSIRLLPLDEIKKIMGIFKKAISSNNHLIDKQNNIITNNYLQNLLDIYERVKAFQSNTDNTFSKEKINFLISEISQKLKNFLISKEIELNSIAVFLEIMDKIPDSFNKQDSLERMNKYPANLLYSNIMRENQELLPEILTKLRLFI